MAVKVVRRPELTFWEKLYLPQILSGMRITLRHFFKTHCINQGVPREMVDRWQGHIDGSVSGRYYHVHDAASKVAMEGVPFGTDTEE